MAELKRIFQVHYVVGWPVWAGGYHTQQEALAAANADVRNLEALVSSSLRGFIPRSEPVSVMWQLGGYRAIQGLNPPSPVPNSLKLAITIFVWGRRNKTFDDVAAGSIAYVIEDWVERSMPGADKGANIYDVGVAQIAAPIVLAGRMKLPPIRKSPYRHGLTLGQLRELAKSPRNGGEDVVDTYYGWRNDRSVSIMKGVGGAALSLFTAWLIPFLKNEYAETPPWLVMGPPLLIISALAVWSLVIVMRINRLHISYAAASALLQTLRP
jgi:hypothetical protein